LTYETHSAYGKQQLLEPSCCVICLMLKSNKTRVLHISNPSLSICCLHSTLKHRSSYTQADVFQVQFCTQSKISFGINGLILKFLTEWSYRIRSAGFCWGSTQKLYAFQLRRTHLLRKVKNNLGLKVPPLRWDVRNMHDTYAHSNWRNQW